MQRILLILLLAMPATFLHAQLKSLKIPIAPTGLTPETANPVRSFDPAVPLSAPPFQGTQVFPSAIPFQKPVAGQPQLKARISPQTGLPYAITGTFHSGEDNSLPAVSEAYLSQAAPLLRLDDPATELVIKAIQPEEPAGYTHIRYQQMWKGIPVYNATAILHLKGNEVYLFNGRTYPSPGLQNLTPGITSEAAAAIALSHCSTFTKVKTLSDREKILLQSEQTESELVVFFTNPSAGHSTLAWKVTAIPNITHRYLYLINAHTGEVLNHHSELCQLTWLHEDCRNMHEPVSSPLRQDLAPPALLDGPATANAIDLSGQVRLINTYEKSNTFFLIDASRSMFKASQSNIPNDPAGVIWTIDAQNTSPENDDFQTTHVTSFNNSWNDPVAVSAHYNGGLAYEYFKNTFGRESINGAGGNIISLVHVAENSGEDMDNAFWNGAAMFYGNGNVAFSAPLAKAADVAGHEMAHGVVQSTANLEYLGESGALNESFADIFGAMIDRDDWKIGEDVVNTAIFQTGALRDMENPNNGGSSLSDPGWQPAHYSERFTGSEDNGGVHINSGIVNKAFQLFADNIGKNKAEQIFYRALDVYLFRSSQFIDCRLAVVQAATDLHGANSPEVNAAHASFDAVGIGSGSGTNNQNDVNVNPGDDFILMTDDLFSALYIFTPDGTPISNPLAFTSPLSRPSVRDDGSAIVYIGEDNTMQAIFIDWQAGTAQQEIIQNEPVWRNVAISRDGRHLAALTTDFDNLLWVYDFGKEEWVTYELYNPTTGQNGPTTGDVAYADVLEWDFTGERVMYDALNRINTANNTDIEYWDISFVRVWSNAGNDFGDGFTSKLFNGLPEDISIGNPTFSKNSDYVIAFDYIDTFNEENFLLATNLETGDVGTIFQNVRLSWPNFSVDDSQMIFDAEDNFGNSILAMVPLATDKINTAGNPFIYLSEKQWGVWFANGERTLVSDQETIERHDFAIYPNPAGDWLRVRFTAHRQGEVQWNLYNTLGSLVRSGRFQADEGENDVPLSLEGMPGGAYLLKVNIQNEYFVARLVKD